MKIVAKSNLDAESFSEYFICTVAKGIDAEWLARTLNKYGGDDTPSYYAAVPDDYKLYKFEP